MEINRDKDDFILTQTTEECGDQYLLDEFESYVIEYYGDLTGALADKDYACAIIINPIYAILGVRVGYLQEVLEKVPNIVNYEINRIFTLSYISPLEAANITKYHNNPYLNLKGDGVVVGIIDTGIDYLNKEFMTEDGKTRILEIWDQTVEDLTPPPGFHYGTVYNRDEINEAIKAYKNNEDPYKIVNSRDEYGHGTSMAGIIGGKGYNGIVGAAPSCEFTIVKLDEASEKNLTANGLQRGRHPVYQTTDIMLAIRYLFTIKEKYNKPLIIYIPLASNFGGHDGSSVLERYIDLFANQSGILFITSCGNEGSSETHYRNKFEKAGEEKTMEIVVDRDQKDLAITIWCSKPDKISVGLISPSGEVIERIPAKVKKTKEIKLVFEGSRVIIEYDYPNDYSGNQNVNILIRDIKVGIWQIKVYADYVVFGTFDAWIYQRELLGSGTKFLSSDPNVTLTIPSTSSAAISTSFYNQTTNSSVIQSGRGFTREDEIKPEVTAGGVDMQATSPGGNIVTLTGSSVAGAVLTGAMTLFYQWAIVQGNDPKMYAQKAKAYIIRGTRKRRGDVYPNREWGFGILDLEGMFDSIRDLDVDKTRNIEVGYSENKETLLMSKEVEVYVTEHIANRLKYSFNYTDLI